MRTVRLLVLVGAVAVSSSSSEAFAGGGHHGFGGIVGGTGYGAYTDYYAPLYQNYIDRLPYHALFPPVYYSFPVPRTYGHSPFAYPPTVMTPELEMTGPVDIINPHVPQSDPPPAPANAKPASDKTAARVQVIINPYITDGGPQLFAADGEVRLR